MPYTSVRLTAFGGPETLELETVPDLPGPAVGEVRIGVLATSAAFTNLMIGKGSYPDVKHKLPFTPGYDMVGMVDATWPGAARFQPGERVADLTTIGAYAEYICLPEDRVARVAEGRFDLVVAEILPLTKVRKSHERIEAGDVKGKLVLRVTER